MIRNTHRFLPAILSMFVVLVLFSSCERDLLLEPTNKQERKFPKIKGKNVSINDLLANPNLAVKLTSLATTSLAKSTNLAGIQIDTTDIRAIETDNYVSYTFQIVQDSVEKQTVLKNYMLTIINDTIEVQHLVNYNVVHPGMYDMDNIQLERVYGDELRGQFAKCQGDTTTEWFSYQDCYVVPCRGENSAGNRENHGMNDNCQAPAAYQPYINCVTRWISYTISEPCSGGGGGANTDGSGSGGGVPIVNPPNDYDDNQDDQFYIGMNPNDGLAPIELPVAVSSLTENLFNSLSQSLQDFINDAAQNELRSAIDTYLLDELHDASAKGFAQEVIKAKEESEDAEIDYDNKLIYNENVPDCLKAIINKLKPTEGFNVNFAGADPRLMQEMQLSNMILDLFNNDAGYSLTIETGDLPPDSITGLRPNAQTSSPVPSTVPATNIFNVAISLDNSYLSAATDLAVARTMIHELIHAYFSYLQRAQPQSDIASQLQFLMNDAAGPRLISNDAEHRVMANQFVDTIANALTVWDNFSIPINANNGIDFDGTPFDYYKLLSWSGQLSNTRDYDNQTLNFKTYSAATNKAEEGIRDIRDAFLLNPKGTNNCQ